MSHSAIPVQMLEKGMAEEAIDALAGEIGKRVQIEHEIAGLRWLNINVHETVKPLMPTPEVVQHRLSFRAR
jgi:hypothetical protein